MIVLLPPVSVCFSPLSDVMYGMSVAVCPFLFTAFTVITGVGRVDHHRAEVHQPPASTADRTLGMQSRRSHRMSSCFLSFFPFLISFVHIAALAILIRHTANKQDANNDYESKNTELADALHMLGLRMELEQKKRGETGPLDELNQHTLLSSLRTQEGRDLPPDIVAAIREFAVNLRKKKGSLPAERVLTSFLVSLNKVDYIALNFFRLLISFCRVASCSSSFVFSFFLS